MQGGRYSRVDSTSVSYAKGHRFDSRRCSENFSSSHQKSTAEVIKVAVEGYQPRKKIRLGGNVIDGAPGETQFDYGVGGISVSDIWWQKLVALRGESSR